jgi:ATP-dependent RNA helicase RhlE
VLEAFKQGEISLLIATDVSARGIDIPNVDLVVNYDLPTPPENYVHRVGRTGRGRHKGRAVSICSEEEQETLAAIEAYLGQPIEELTLDRVDYADTLDASLDADTDWKALMREAEREGKKGRRKE